MSTVGQPLNFEAADPAAPSGAVNVVFQADAPTTPPTATVRNISAYMPPMTATTGGAVPTPPNVATKYLNGQGAWTTPAGGGGGGSNDDISYYLSPATITPPTLSAWGYHANATAGANANGAMVLSTYSSPYFEIIGEAISSSDFDLIACMIANPPLVSGATMAMGLALWDSGSGKIVRYFLQLGYNGTSSLNVQHDPSFTSGSPVSVANPDFNVGWGTPVWLRINCSYGKFTFYVSVDGQSWDEVYQESSTAYLPVAATNAGVGFYQSGTTVMHLVVPHFVVNSYVGS